jgi:hypothetical protein
MPTVTLSLRSQRSKPVTDRVSWIEVRGRFSGPLMPNDIELRQETAEVVLDLVPDRYTIEIEVPGFEPTTGRLDVGSVALARVFPLANLCTTLPLVSELETEQRRLLQTLDSTKTPGEIWNALTDNKAATFFQVTYGLSQITVASGAPLSSTVDRIVRLGGSELTAPDTSGTLRTVIGWRMHVVFVGGPSIETLLGQAGFKRDPGAAHPTHKRFGFVRSFREKQGAPKMQVVINHEGSGADVDLDAGAFHRSSPHDIYKSFAKRFPAAAKIYKVK